MRSLFLFASPLVKTNVYIDGFNLYCGFGLGVGDGLGFAAFSRSRRTSSRLGTGISWPLGVCCVFLRGMI